MIQGSAHRQVGAVQQVLQRGFDRHFPLESRALNAADDSPIEQQFRSGLARKAHEGGRRRLSANIDKRIGK